MLATQAAIHFSPLDDNSTALDCSKKTIASAIMRIVRSNIVVKRKVRNPKSSVEMTVISARFLYKIISDTIIQADIKRMANRSFFTISAAIIAEKDIKIIVPRFLFACRKISSRLFFCASSAFSLSSSLAKL